MELLVSGATLLAVVAGLFWYCLPRGGRTISSAPNWNFTWLSRSALASRLASH
jgi:hypothetical protein